MAQSAERAKAVEFVIVALAEVGQVLAQYPSVADEKVFTGFAVEDDEEPSFESGLLAETTVGSTYAGLRIVAEKYVNGDYGIIREGGVLEQMRSAVRSLKDVTQKYKVQAPAAPPPVPVQSTPAAQPSAAAPPPQNKPAKKKRQQPAPKKPKSKWPYIAGGIALVVILGIYAYSRRSRTGV